VAFEAASVHEPLPTQAALTIEFELAAWHVPVVNAPQLPPGVP
jgi:hypothetical protein